MLDVLTLLQTDQEMGVHVAVRSWRLPLSAQNCPTQLSYARNTSTINIQSGNGTNEGFWKLCWTRANALPSSGEFHKGIVDRVRGGRYYRVEQLQ